MSAYDRRYCVSLRFCRSANILDYILLLLLSTKVKEQPNDQVAAGRSAFAHLQTDSSKVAQRFRNWGLMLRKQREISSRRGKMVQYLNALRVDGLEKDFAREILVSKMRRVAGRQKLKTINWGSINEADTSKTTRDVAEELNVT
ncbi:hypothetical protein NECAME_09428 [Necator americanus]|uniref:Uncharacterized protein n=1 Tax=Necator americanus TaxID=51031 RepID=W2TFT9_NECAM|nr:hypothetical protein NECAME_09428 [Necator americanus]ETN80061.1 hypothetical protein NECAME_09428 [Necator americanus]